jgi:hypothetical protein
VEKSAVNERYGDGRGEWKSSIRRGVKGGKGMEVRKDWGMKGAGDLNETRDQHGTLGPRVLAQANTVQIPRRGDC